MPFLGRLYGFKKAHGAAPELAVGKGRPRPPHFNMADFCATPKRRLGENPPDDIVRRRRAVHPRTTKGEQDPLMGGGVATPVVQNPKSLAPLATIRRADPHPRPGGLPPLAPRVPTI